MDTYPSRTERREGRVPLSESRTKGSAGGRTLAIRIDRTSNKANLGGRRPLLGIGGRRLGIRGLGVSTECETKPILTEEASALMIMDY